MYILKYDVVLKWNEQDSYLTLSFASQPDWDGEREQNRGQPREDSGWLQGNPAGELCTCCQSARRLKVAVVCAAWAARAEAAVKAWSWRWIWWDWHSTPCSPVKRLLFINTALCCHRSQADFCTMETNLDFNAQHVCMCEWVGVWMEKTSSEWNVRVGSRWCCPTSSV